MSDKIRFRCIESRIFSPKIRKGKTFRKNDGVKKNPFEDYQTWNILSRDDLKKLCNSTLTNDSFVA